MQADSCATCLPGRQAGIAILCAQLAAMQELVAARTAGASTLAEAEDLIAQDALQPAQPHSSMPAGPDGGTQVHTVALYDMLAQIMVVAPHPAYWEYVPTGPQDSQCVEHGMQLSLVPAVRFCQGVCTATPSVGLNQHVSGGDHVPV